MLGNVGGSLLEPANLLLMATGFAPDQVAADGSPTRPGIPSELRDLGSDLQLGLRASGDFQLTGFSDFSLAGSRLSAEQVQQTLRSALFVDELDRLRRHLREELDLDRTTAIEVAGLSLGVSLVYVLWLIRGGVLLGSYLSAMPAWRLLDPLPVLARRGDEEEDEDDEEPLAGGRPAPADPLRGFA